MARYIDIDKMREYNCPRLFESGEACPDEGCAECFYNNGGAEDVAPVGHAKWIRFEQTFESMCRRCVNYEACQGAGCEPLKVLKDFIIEQDLIDDVIDE